MSRVECVDPKTGQWLPGYELGLLAEDERVRFEDHVLGCDSCREELYAMAPYSATMILDPGEVVRLAGRAPHPAPDRGSVLSRALDWFRSKEGNWVPSRVLAPVGAFAAIALVIFLRAGAPSVSDLARVEPVPYVTLQTRDVDVESAAELFREGMGHYVDGRWGEAAVYLEDALGRADDAWPDRETAGFYLGLSLLLADEPARAVSHLKRASESEILPVADRGSWYLAQTFLKLGDGDRATEVLRSLAESSPAYADEAAEQLRELAGE